MARPTGRIERPEPLAAGRQRSGPTARGAWLPITLGAVIVVGVGVAIALATGAFRDVPPLTGGAPQLSLGTPQPLASTTALPAQLSPAAQSSSVAQALPAASPKLALFTPISAPIAPPTPTSTRAATPSPVLSPTPTVPPTLSPAALRDAAIERVQRESYTARDPQTYDARAQLRVVVGARIGASNDYRAFFFLSERYLGTDTLEPSAAPLSAVQQDSTTIAVQYALFRPSDNTCCPSGGSATVRYRWAGDHLEPLDPIPTNQPNAPLSRR